MALMSLSTYNFTIFSFSRRNTMTNYNNLIDVAGAELPFVLKRKDQFLKMPWHRHSIRVACPYSSAAGKKTVIMERRARPTRAFFFHFNIFIWRRPLNNDANFLLLFAQVVVKTENVNFIIFGNENKIFKKKKIPPRFLKYDWLSLNDIWRISSFHHVPTFFNSAGFWWIFPLKTPNTGEVARLWEEWKIVRFF